MVLAAGFGVVGLVMGLQILYHGGDVRGRTTSAVFFVCGLLLMIALTGYTVKTAWKSDVFFSWSYFLGWLALPFSILAGNLDSGKRVEETTQGNLLPQSRPSRPSRKPHFDLPGTPPHAPVRSRVLPQTRQVRPASPKPQAPGPPGHRPGTHRPPPPPPLPPGFCFLLADMILQSTEAISGFPVCL